MRDDNDKPKGAAQLAIAVKKLFSTSEEFENPWFERTAIKKCYTALITLDDLGGITGISALLSLDFYEELAEAALTCEHHPLFCLDVETLELCSAAFGSISLARMLEEWLARDPQLLTPLSHFNLPHEQAETPVWLKQRLREFTTRVAGALISPESLATDRAYQRDAATSS